MTDADPPIGTRLYQLVSHAHLLQVLSYRITTHLSAAAGNGGTRAGDQIETRKALTEFETILRAVRHCGDVSLGDLDPGVTKLVSAVFTRAADAALGAFTDTVRDLLAQLEDGRAPERTAVAELIRMVGEDLVPVLDTIAGAARMAFDIGHRTAQELAFTDDLTGLPNRRALYQLAARVERAVREGAQVSAFLVDLDRFKSVNDSFGHAGGDAALLHAAAMLKRNTRASDVVARVGGDEFALVIFGAFDEAALDRRAAAICDDIATPFAVAEGQMHRIEASIGIATAQPYGQTSLEALMNNADLALYAAKNGGRGHHRFFAGKLRNQVAEVETLRRQILDGLKRGEFVAYFQPQVNGRTGKLVGVEALVRWNHPERGILTPFHFMSVAEESSLLTAVDDAMMKNAFAAMQAWREEGIDVPQVSINLSAERLADSAFFDQIGWMSESYGLQPEQIGLEILESAMVEAKNSRLIENAQRLSGAGYRLELDDFGTGHASIANLRHFAVHRIKIDKSFVKDLHIFADLSKITSAMIGLAHSLRIDALAEGVESPEERLVLNALGCDHIQGYGVARPMPQSEIVDWVRRTQRKVQLPNRIRRTVG